MVIMELSNTLAVEPFVSKNIRHMTNSDQEYVVY